MLLSLSSHEGNGKNWPYEEISPILSYITNVRSNLATVVLLFKKEN